MNGVISLHVGCGFEDQKINSLFYFNFCHISDIYFYQDDIDEDSESGFSDSYNACDNPDEGLSSIAKLEKYSASENIFNR